MTFKELNIGDVFRSAGDATLWRKTSPTLAAVLGRSRNTRTHRAFRDKVIELVERAPDADIRRMDNTLVLRNGEVTLQCAGARTVYRCTPGETFTEFVLAGASLGGSEPTGGRLTESESLWFSIELGSKHLNRPNGTYVFAYRGRVYGRATNKEIHGKSKYGGYKVVSNVGGARRITIAGVLTVPSEFALYDIIMEHFGPDTKPQKAEETGDAAAG